MHICIALFLCLVILALMSIAPQDRLIFALDVPNYSDAVKTIDSLGDAVTFYKIGLELNASGEYFKTLEYLKSKGKKVFADLKYHDIPNTVEQATKTIAKFGINFLTVHGEPTVVIAARTGAQGTNTKILAVTVLTSMSEGDFDIYGTNLSLNQIVKNKATESLSCGADGLICSGLEVEELKSLNILPDGFIAVCPGIRPFATADDQSRTVNVKQAFANGADYIVVGRPISKAEDPHKAAVDIQTQIAEIF